MAHDSAARAAAPERPARFDENVQGKRQEGAPDETMDAPLAALDGLRSRSPRRDAESPKKGCCRHTFDKAIEDKAHEGDAIGSLTGPEGHDPFHDVISHGAADKPKTDALPMTYGGRPGHK